MRRYSSGFSNTSGSALDPHTSVQLPNGSDTKYFESAKSPGDRLEEGIIQNTEDIMWRLFGPSKVNVFKLNLAIDNLK